MIEEKERLAGNIIIAKFMGLKNLYAPNWFTDGDKIGFYANDNTCYHSSWNLLIPAVKKVFELKNVFCDEMTRLSISIRRLETEEIWNTLVAFIQWYKNEDARLTNLTEHGK